MPGAYNTSVLMINDKGIGEIEFTNDYFIPPVVTVSKKLTGDFADFTKPFEFTMTLQDKKTHQPVVSNAVKKDGVSVTLVNGEYTFALKHGQTAEFEGLSTDWEIKIKETGVQAYKPSYVITKRGEDEDEYKAEEYGVSLATENLEIEQGSRIFAFTNDREDIILTGLENTTASDKALMYIAYSLIMLGAAFVILRLKRNRAAVRHQR
jgi:hypothetical protein